MWLLNWLKQNNFCKSVLMITLNQSFSNCGPRTTSGRGFCPCGPFSLNISPKKTEKNKINVNCVSHTVVENLKQSLEITYNKRL